jgi:chemotaxis protein MotB
MKLHQLRNLSILLSIAIILSSCIVSKKKYDALQKSKTRSDKKVKNLSKELKQKNENIANLNTSYDSLGNILADKLIEYNDIRNQLIENNAMKTSEIDSLSVAVMGLTSDTTALNNELRKAIDSYNKEKDNFLSLKKQLEEKEQRLSILTAELEQKQKRLSQLEKMIEENKKQVNSLKNTIDDALNAFDATELTVYKKDGKVYVSLDEKLLFKSGSDKVGTNGVKALKELAKVLEGNPEIAITIEGHTDNVGNAKLNWDLSTKRATSIVQILQDNSTIDPVRFTASGRGMYLPIDSADTKEARQTNRRTEIILTPKLDELYEILSDDEKSEE